MFLRDEVILPRSKMGTIGSEMRLCNMDAKSTADRLESKYEKNGLECMDLNNTVAEEKVSRSGLRRLLRSSYTLCCLQEE